MGGDDKTSSVDSLIDANLRRVYDTVLQEEVPDRFAQLLQKLRAGGEGGSDATTPEFSGLQDRDGGLRHRDADRSDGVE